MTIALVALAAIPWLTATIESVGFPGGSLKLRRIESTQLRQAREIETLGFLLTMVASRLREGRLRGELRQMLTLVQPGRNHDLLLQGAAKPP